MRLCSEKAVDSKLQLCTRVLPGTGFEWRWNVVSVFDGLTKPLCVVSFLVQE